MVIFKTVHEVHVGYMILKSDDTPAIKSKDLGIRSAKLTFAFYEKESQAIKALGDKEGFKLQKVELKVGEHDGAIAYVGSQEWGTAGIVAVTTQYPQWYYKDHTKLGKNTVEWDDSKWYVKQKFFGTCRPIAIMKGGE